MVANGFFLNNAHAIYVYKRQGKTLAKYEKGIGMLRS